MMVRFYLILQQIEDTMDNKWIEMKEFNDFLRSIDNLDENKKAIQKRKLNHFLRIIKSSLTKHFCIWVTSELMCLSLFSEAKIATCISKFMMGQEQQEQEDFYSNFHDCTINMHKLTQFLHNQCKVSTLMKIRNSHFSPTMLWQSDS